jgi:hypothetical protein
VNVASVVQLYPLLTIAILISDPEQYFYIYLIRETMTKVRIEII